MLRVLESFSDAFPWRQAVFSLRPDPCVGEEYAFLAACLKKRPLLPPTPPTPPPRLKKPLTISTNQQTNSAPPCQTFKYLRGIVLNCASFGL